MLLMSFFYFLDFRLWCICRRPSNNRFMICCDGCEEWFHGSCVNMTRKKAAEMKNVKWYCSTCRNSDEQPQEEQAEKPRTPPHASDQIVQKLPAKPRKRKASADLVSSKPLTVMPFSSFNPKPTKTSSFNS